MGSATYTSSLKVFLQLGLLVAMWGFSFLSMQAQEYRYEWGATAHLNNYMGDANKRNPFSALGGGAGLVMRYNYNFRVAFSGDLSYLYLQGRGSDAHQSYAQAIPQGHFQSHLYQLAVRGEYNFFPYSDKFPFLQTRRWSPYVALGAVAGAAQNGSHWAVTPGVEGALGIKVKLRNRLNASLSLSGRHYFCDQLDALALGREYLNNPYQIHSSWYKGGDGLLLLSLAVTYEFSVRGSSCNHNEQIAR